MNFNLIILLFFVFPTTLKSQSNKSFRVSFFQTSFLGFSKLTNPQKDFSSKPYPSFSDYGFALEYLKNPKIIPVLKVSSSSLIINGTFDITLADYDNTIDPANGVTGQKSSSTIYNSYQYVSLGAKREFVKNKTITFNFEGGLMFTRRINNEEDISIDYFPMRGSTLGRRMEYLYQKKHAVIPYIASGIDFSYKKFRLGVQFYYQNGFTNLCEYNYKVIYRDLKYETNIVSRGKAIGANVFLKLFMF
jgi:hypothetical protein